MSRAVPFPVIDEKEMLLFDEITYKYREKLNGNTFSHITSRAADFIPEDIKKRGRAAKKSVTEQEWYLKGIEILSEGFGTLEQKTVRYGVSKNTILKNLNNNSPVVVQDINEICLLRGYEVSSVVMADKQQNTTYAFIEGGATGAMGFGGIPFNLVLSTFLFYKAVQSVAMYYGYDVKNDPVELVIAGSVFVNALNGSESVDELSASIDAFMSLNFNNGVKALDDGISTTEIILKNIIAYAENNAEITREEKNKKTLEERLFKEIYEQIGKRLAKMVLGRSVPLFSFAFSAFFDSIQMDKIVEFANAFYCKRFIAEKEQRIEQLMS